MTYQEISAALQDRRIKAVAEGADLSRDTIRALRDGTARPTKRTLRRIAAYLQKTPAQREVE